MTDCVGTSPQRILVLGAGFAGLWSAIGAARKLAECKVGRETVEVVIVNLTRWHSIRVRDYEADLSETLVPLADVLGPIGVRHIEAEVTDIDLDLHVVSYSAEGALHKLHYDRLVFALGSRLDRPAIAGLQAHAFDVDTYEGATRLNMHLRNLPLRPPTPGQYTVLIVGAGLTGIETAAEMPARLAALSPADPARLLRVILADRQNRIGSDMGDSARPIIAEALRALGVETRVCVSLASVDEHGGTLASGERIEAATVIWCAGLQAHPLTARFLVGRDRLGRLPVDACLKVNGRTEFAAGDVAWLTVDGVHASVMSCQHARPMGRYAGHNVVCNLLGLPMLALEIDSYVTVLDLGAWGAVYTEGYDRRIVASGASAKRVKETINRQRIYPPLSRSAPEILAAAAPVVQAAPARS